MWQTPHLGVAFAKGNNRDLVGSGECCHGECDCECECRLLNGMVYGDGDLERGRGDDRTTGRMTVTGAVCSTLENAPRF